MRHKLRSRSSTASSNTEVVTVSSPRAAELTKLLENTFGHVNIALVNEFAIFARELGVNVWEILLVASTKPFGFMPFHPGPGRRRPLPADRPDLPVLACPASQRGDRFRFVELANDINDHMPEYVVRRITEGLNRLGRPVLESRVLLLGLAYKKGLPSDARESPARQVARQLVSLGARVSAADN